MAATTRRGLLAAGGAGAAAALGGSVLVNAADDEGAARRSSEVVPFFGEHQAGIATPAQDRLHFAAFDVTTTDPRELRDMLRVWTEAAARMTRGRSVESGRDSPLAPPTDTGEAQDLDATRLTVTFGLGPGLFDDRFGLAGKRPAALRPIPPLPGDVLDPDRTGGDLCVQACADDPQVAFHAVRNLARLGRGTVTMRWSQLGFGRTSTTSRTQGTPRNLMGFKDGTNNIVGEDRKAMDGHVWVQPGSDQAWLTGGSYLVARRIRMLIEVWDRASLDDQQRTIGRVKHSGAPLGGGPRENDKVDLKAKDRKGELAVPDNAHIRLAAPASNGGTRLLRRGYSFTDGQDPQLGQLDAGLFFLAYMNDPAAFVRVQRALGVIDALDEYIKHTGSAVFVVPPGIRRGGHVADALFA